MSATTDLVANRLTRDGIDLAASTSVAAYNAAVGAAHRLPGPADSTVMVVGNTAALWPHIERFARAEGSHVADPVDRFVEGVVADATADVGGVIDIRFSHEPPPRRIAIQRLAHLAGLAWLSPSHLCVHPDFGPWIALRAAIVFDEPVGAVPAEPKPPCDCSQHCLPLLARALEAGEPSDGAELAERWRLWLAVRDACPVGKPHRYPNDQIRYHYTGVRPERWGGEAAHSEA